MTNGVKGHDQVKEEENGEQTRIICLEEVDYVIQQMKVGPKRHWPG